jgi:hypothetical protein
MKRFFFYRYGSEEVKPTDLLMSNTSVSGDYSKQNSLRIITGRGMTLNRECIHGRCQIVLRANINRVFFYEIQAELADTSGRGRTVEEPTGPLNTFLPPRNTPQNSIVGRGLKKGAESGNVQLFQL